MTKGKITKLYNKKGQSRNKKKNKKQTSRKNKSFRKKRSLNLASRTLKKGGDNIEPVDELVDKSLAQDIQTPILEEEYDPPANIETYQQQLGNDQQSADNIGSLTEETTLTSVEPTINTDVQENQLEPTINTDVQENQLEPTINTDVQENKLEPTINTVAQENQLEPSNNTQLDEEAKQNKQIADAVKLLANTLGTDVYIPQNGFESNKTASETLSQTGGKKHKTRKFRLTKRNKSTK